MGPLVESCDTWHIADVGDRWDSSIISAAVLRRDLVNPFLCKQRSVLNHVRALSFRVYVSSAMEAKV